MLKVAFIGAGGRAQGAHYPCVNRLEDVSIEDVVIDGPEVPLFIRLGNRARPYREGLEAPRVGILRNVQIRNVEVQSGGSTGCSVTGIPGHPVQNISLSNIRMHLKGGVRRSALSAEVPELESHYPEATMFGVLPASVLYLRHAEKITLKGIEVHFREADERIHLLADDVSGLSFEGIRVDGKETIRIFEQNKKME